MPWKDVTLMEQRQEFIQLATQPNANIKLLCKRYGISRKTGYKWLKRHQKSPADPNSLQNQSRRRHSQPHQTSDEVLDLLLESRDQHPAWGARKLKVWLESKGYTSIPSAPTINKLLKQKGRIDINSYQKETAWVRFEHPHPNDLWQMDFKGYVEMQHGRCHPLTVLDDHSRFSILLRACSAERRSIVMSAMIDVFRQYGLPFAINVDNGPPWGCVAARYTKLSLWLIKLGVRVSFSRPLHPQTNGKEERFHRTLKSEVLQYHTFYNLEAAQIKFNQWRDIYNLERPHEALGMLPPVARYQASKRSYPEVLPLVEYDSTHVVRKVSDRGYLRFANQLIFIGKAFEHEFVGIKLDETDGKHLVYFSNQIIRTFTEEELSMSRRQHRGSI